MKRSKKLLTFLLSIFITISLTLVVPIPANAAGYSISTQYYGYNSSQNITISYSGTASKDWIGIYKINTTPSGATYDAALAWKYTVGSSGSMTFTPSDFINAPYSPNGGSTLKPGTYKAVILKNDGYTVAASDTFQIQDAEPDYSFEVISDIHVNGPTGAADNLKSALNDIKIMSPNDSFIVANGDSVNQTGDYYYNSLRDCFSSSKSGLPFTFFNLGNHELFDSLNPGNNTGSSFSYKFNKFLSYSKSIHSILNNDPDNYSSSDNRTVPYYEQVVNNHHLFFLSSESLASPDKADLSNTQLDWLDNRLWNIAKYGDDQPVFVFLHQSISNTVAGSYDYQGWSGVIQDSALRFILNKYPNVFFFSGHSHWNLASQNTMFQDRSTYGSTLGATMFNTASITNLWSDAGYMDGSQGFHVDVFNDKVVVSGRDFLHKKWIPSAKFTIDLNAKYDAMHSQNY